uniref:T9SS type A sorting domain-containing protein n=1 Tax=candidate division WOR-3 bacterium TaxID=2052148 RepID=A0A7C3YS69_UNCW3
MRRKKYLCWKIGILFFLLSFNLFARSLSLEFSSPILEKRGEFDRILLPDCELTGEVGRPELPVFGKTFLLPRGAKVSQVRLKGFELETLPSSFTIFPTQPQYPLSLIPREKYFAFDTSVYQSEDLYPGKVFELVGIGKGKEGEIAEFLIYPIQYQPKSGKVLFYKRIDLEIGVENGENKERKEEYGNMEYLIITSPPLDTVFARLADWKTKKGVPSKIRTVSWIEANYPGRDRAEKIRNYLKTLPDSGTKWVLLGGDTDIIPCRYAYAMTCSANIHPREDFLPSDLYYSDLDGNWNFDGDTIFGEVEDSIDLYPDLFVGRAPVRTVSEAQGFVNKVLTYEKNPPADYLTNVLFFAEVLWSSPYTDGGVHKDKMERESFSSDFNITKLYQRLGNLSRSSVMSAIRNGQNLLNHDGHGWIDVMSTGGTTLRNADMDTITNLNCYGVLYSIGCWTTAYDYDCIAEHYVKNSRGGGIGFIGNSSYGWGSPGNPGFGYSDKFDNRFFSELLKNGRRLGEALAYAKIHYIPFSRQKNVYRWHQYQVNLLGDPEISVWTKRPCSLTVYSPPSIPRGGGRILFQVSYDGRPVENALVCLQKGDESYDRGLTDEKGEVFLLATPQTSGDFSLTVTAPNFYPRERNIPVVAGGYINFLGFLLNDSLGNNDRIVNPNETVFVSPIFKNAGDGIVENINLILFTSDSLVRIVDSLSHIASLSPGESVVVRNAFCLVTGEIEDGHSVSFDLRVRSNQEWHYKPSLLVGRPNLKIYYAEVKERPSRPGEVKKINIALSNLGFGIGHSIWARLISIDPYFMVLSPESLFYGEIQPKSVKRISDTFLIAISPSCPGSYQGNLVLSLSSEDYNFFDTFPILIGETGFSDDLESGPSLWETGGTGNLWHLSVRRAHSGNTSWYCGDEWTGRYNNNMDCYIQTIPFMVEANSHLKFWRWFKVPNYGVDGIYVIILSANRAETLDFIGTGGALGEGKVIESEWCLEDYDLSFLRMGETIRVRIAFKSDNDGQTSEGFYIDDLTVGGLPPEIPSFVKERVKPSFLPYLFLFPNPTKRGLFIEVKSQADLEGGAILISDAQGRLVRRIPLLGEERIYWDRKDTNGRLVPSGLYLLFLNKSSSVVRKVILLD